MKWKCRHMVLPVLLIALLMLTACGSRTIDDFATNEGYGSNGEAVQAGDSSDEQGMAPRVVPELPKKISE